MRAIRGFERAGIFESYKPEVGLAFVFRFTQRGAAFGDMMQRAAERAEIEAAQKENLAAAERAQQLAERSKDNPDAAAELLERLLFMENSLAEHVIPKPTDIGFAMALDEMAKAGTYPEDSDLVRKARDVLLAVSAEQKANAEKQATQGGAP
jgi:hypothetical protein